jgi:hypothetical protein
MRMGSFQVAWSKVIPFERFVDGPVMDGADALSETLEAVPEKLNIARRMPAEQSATATKTRRWKRPELGVRFFIELMIGWHEPGWAA